MLIDDMSRWLVACLLLSLRVAPVFLFAPPFTLVRLPRRVRALLGIGLSTALASGISNPIVPPITAPGVLIVAAAHELAIGLTFVMAFQLLFGALYFAGRTIDIQTGFGLAVLVDPTNRSQTPLIGTLFGYIAGVTFFAAQGHLALLRVFSGSLASIPLGASALPNTLQPLLIYIAAVFSAALGVAGAVILALFLVDMAIAMLARTVPQMNVLMLGFQVKTLVLLLVLPVTFGLGAAMIARMVALTLSSLPGLL